MAIIYAGEKMRKPESAWNEQEIFELFKLIENYKKNNKAIIKAFEKYASMSNRKKNSVRNYYYAKLKEFERDTKLAQKFNVDFKWHTKSEQIFFTPEETELSMKKINNLLEKGYSVRKACFEVACGDVKKMLRFQNKYRNLNHKSKNQNKPKNSFSDISSNELNLDKILRNNIKNSDNILVMPHQKTMLTDGEITSLFMGLVKLVKKTARTQCDMDVLSQMQSANAELRKSIKTLADKDREIKFFRKKFELLTNEKTKLKEELSKLRSQNAELIKAGDSPIKFKKLKNYIDNLGKKTNTSKETT